MYSSVFYDINTEGDSDQVAAGNTVSGDLIQQQIKFVRGQPPMFLSSSEVSDRIACHVPAPNHELVAKELCQSRVVGLLGSPGSGRTTAAIVAMRQLQPDLPIRRFALEDEDSAEINVAEACGYLINAKASGSPRLATCVAAVRKSGSYLAVIADPQIQIPPNALFPWIALESAQPVQVYRHWVSRYGLPGWADWDEAAVLLEGALPADARRLADLAAKSAALGCDAVPARAEVAQAYRGWEDQLRNWFTVHTQPHERALLIAAVTLPAGAEESYVYGAASSLAQRLKIQVSGGGLVWCPVSGIRELLRAEHEDDLVVFRRIGYAESALRHALADYPLARPELFSWLAALPAGEAAVCQMADTVAQTFADLAADHGEADYITGAARKWGQDDLADLAFIALSRTCLHPLVGPQVRRALYSWSRTAGAPQTLKLTIARVCEPLGQTYTAMALTRLKHLATYSDRRVAAEVINATKSLAQGHFPEVFAAVAGWCAQTNRENLSEAARQRRRKVGAILFLELIRSTTPVGLPRVLERTQMDEILLYVTGWRAIFEFSGTPGISSSEVHLITHMWLDAALRDSQLRGLVREIVVSAAGPSAPSPDGNWTRRATLQTASAELVVSIVQRWATTGPANPLRLKLRDEIVIPLTFPIWLRLIRIICGKLRRLRGMLPELCNFSLSQRQYATTERRPVGCGVAPSSPLT